MEKNSKVFFLCDYSLSLRKINAIFSIGIAKYDMEEQDNNQLNIELTEEVAEGIYSNLAIITHSNTEFVVDFIRVMPGIPKAKVKSRVVLTPEHAKRLMKAFQDNIAKYEAVNGKIDTHDEPPFPMNFGGPTAQA